MSRALFQKPGRASRDTKHTNCWFLLLTQHDERGGPLLVAGGVGGVLAGVAAGVGHPQVFDLDGGVPQVIVEEDHALFEGRVGEALPVHGVEHSDVVPLTVNRLPDPRDLQETGLIKNTRLNQREEVLFHLTTWLKCTL